jgi:hypothetical protein
MMNTQASNTVPHAQPEMLTPVQLAQRVGISLWVLSDWRNKGIGPAYIKLGISAKARVRYPIKDVIAWEESLPRHEPTAALNAEAAHVGL